MRSATQHFKSGGRASWLTRLCGRLRGLVVAGCLLAGPVLAEEPPTPLKLEYQLKAGFLMNFGKLTEWPEVKSRAGAAFRIGVLDGGEALAVIAATLKGKQIKGRPVEVSRVETNGDWQAFEIVFVPRDQAERGPELVKQVGNLPVLTVGESPGFAAAGGRINFVLKDQAVRFEVNLESASQAGLKISSKMAAMATVVAGKEPKP